MGDELRASRSAEPNGGRAEGGGGSPEPRSLDRLAVWEGRAVDLWRDAWSLPHLEIHDSLPSTQDRARVLAEEGLPAHTTVIADEQTRGRGRGGALWVSEHGAGLWLSILLGGGGAGYLPLLVGLAVAEAIEQTLPGARPRIEWPNDVTVDDRKVAGVLCEHSAAGVVAGIGINTRTPKGGFPPDVAVRAAALDVWAGGAGVARSILTGHLLTGVAARTGAHGAIIPPELLRALRARDALAGRHVETEQEGRGRALGIADDGALLLERADGERVEVRSGRVRPGA